jgi:hypothetical protein
MNFTKNPKICSLGIIFFEIFFIDFFGGWIFWIFFCENAERSGATSEDG